jgi:tRNA modification GTPase
MKNNNDTIVAIGTPSGYGAIGIIRISGINAYSICECITKQSEVKHHNFYLLSIFNRKNEFIDKCIVLYFKGPNSFTGEDIVEIQAHGNPILLDYILNEIIFYGARLANPGEFSERAFYNNKIDLIQAEAIADLINASHIKAVQAASRSLQGAFSEKINNLVKSIIYERTYIEANLNFPDDEIEIDINIKLVNRLIIILYQMQNIKKLARNGNILKDGLHIAIIGDPNVGKSSLFNLLSQDNNAIVTNIPGTTRDILKQQIYINNIPFNIIDTAGLRETNDIIEKEGIKKAKEVIKLVDIVIVIVSTIETNYLNKIYNDYSSYLKDKNINIIFVVNKIDLINHKYDKLAEYIYISVKKNIGINLIKQKIMTIVGYNEYTENNLLARRRHLIILDNVINIMNNAITNYKESNALELLAIDLLYIQTELGYITGEVTSDDILGEIFSSFCLGK